VRRQHQHPTSGSPPQTIGLQRLGRVVIPLPANDNARSSAARATTLALAAVVLVVAGWIALRLLG
jgi:hypothetical protein